MNWTKLLLCIKLLLVGLSSAGATKERQWLENVEYFEGALPPAQGGHSMAFLFNQLCLYGGGDFYIFNIEDRLVSKIHFRSASPSIFYAQISVAGEKLFLYGGMQPDVWELNLARLAWTRMALLSTLGYPTNGTSIASPQPPPRMYHGFTGGPAPSPSISAACGGESAGEWVYVYGGRSSSGDVLGDFLGLNPAARRWCALPSSGGLDNSDIGPGPRHQHTLTALGSRLYVFGGIGAGMIVLGDFWAVDLNAGAWIDLSADTIGDAPPSPRIKHAAVAGGGRVYIYGGDASIFFGTHSRQQLHAYDPERHSWETLNASGEPSPRQQHAMASHGQRVWLHGGIDLMRVGGASNQYGDMHVFDPASATWAELTSAPIGEPPHHCVLSRLIGEPKDQFVFLQCSDGEGLWSLHRLDLRAWAWKTFLTSGDAPSPRWVHGLAAADGRIYIHGGIAGNIIEALDDLHVFDPEQSAWSSLSTDGSPPSPRFGHGFAADGLRLWVFGGKISSDPFSSSLLADLFVLELSNMSWNEQKRSESETWPAARSNTCFVSDGHGHIYLHGGQSIGGVQNDLWVLDTSKSSDAWTDISNQQFGSIPSMRSDHECTWAGKCLFILNGFNVGWIMDLHMFCPEEMLWTELSTISPSFTAMTSIGSHLYLHFMDNGESKSLAMAFPKQVAWVRGEVEFVGLYDWDTLVMKDGDMPMLLDAELDLCTFYYPCSLSLRGPGRVRREGNGSFSCIASLGCDSVIVSSIDFDCLPGEAARFSVFRAQGTHLKFTNVTFTGCWSRSDGAAMQINGGVVASVTNSRFEKCFSMGMGGAVASLQSQLAVFGSVFDSCSAMAGGGCLWAGTHRGGFDNPDPLNIVSLDFCQFHHCSASGSGGALLATAEVSTLATQTVAVKASRAYLTACSSGESGGGFAAVGATVKLEIREARVEDGWAAFSGGAIFVSEGAQMALLNSLLRNNSAMGIGGGGLAVWQARVFAFETSFVGNRALDGGGGAIYWHKSITPALDLAVCPAGMETTVMNCAATQEENASCSWMSCGRCPEGTFQHDFGASSCLACTTGTYASAEGQSKCLACPPGAFSSHPAATTAEVCEGCPVGTFSSALGSSACSWCWAGSFTSASYSLVCSDCSPGMQSSKVGATSPNVCMPCAAGSFASAPSSTVCNECAPGSFTAETVSWSCQGCPGGTYSSAAAASASANCVACHPGTYSLPEATMCRACESGTYASQLGAENCGSCDAGWMLLKGWPFVPMECQSCGAGSFSALPGSSACTLCPAGTWLSASSATGCLPCAAGWFSSAEAATGSEACSACQAGTFSEGSGMSACTSCSAGTYLSASGATECVACDAGKSSISQAATDSLACTSCLPGFFSEAFGASACQECQAGSFSPNISEVYCTACAAGESSSAAGASHASACASCEAGSFASAEGSSACVPCPAGQYSNGSRSSACRECDAGQSALRVADICFNGKGRCLWCEPGGFAGKEGAVECSTCPAGTFASGMGQSTCVDCQFSSANNDFPGHTIRSGDAQRDDRKETECVSSQPGMIMRGSIGRKLHTHLVLSVTRSQIRLLPFRGLTALARINETAKAESSIIEFRDFLKLQNLSIFFRGSPHFATDMCGEGNLAAYGPCIASSTAGLDVLMEASRVYAGLPFSLRIQALDWHNQKVAADHVTFLTDHFGLWSQAISFFSLSETGDHAVQLFRGEARPTRVVRPAYSEVSPERGLARLREEVQVVVSGKDGLIGTELSSLPILVPFPSASEPPCPVGYVLQLEDFPSGAGGSMRGGCEKCPAGSYSFNPLVGPVAAGNASARAGCFNCPLTSSCAGGAAVTPGPGTWELAQGMLRLVACPWGNQLVNSVERVFAHDLQHCSPCLSGQYLLSSNRSDFSCQQCPVGAVCMNISLRGAVEGSFWEPDWVTGQYRLQSCPPGYELLNMLSNGKFSYLSQECRMCPAAYYCLGGASSRVACPANMFSQQGTNTSAGCQSAFFVQIALVLIGLRKDLFDEQKQLGFGRALAYACGVKSSNVVLVDFANQEVAARRHSEKTMKRSSAASALRSQGGLLRINAQIATRSPDEAASVASEVDVGRINIFLEVEGLPPAQLLAVQVQSQNTRSQDVGLVIGLVAGLCGLAVALVLGVAAAFTRNKESAEAKELRLAMVALRERLGVTQKHGYFLSNERIPSGRGVLGMWASTPKDIVVIQRASMEAAARLDLFRDFDCGHFDAFCLSIEFGDSGARYQGEHTSAQLSLRRWLLDKCALLIRPDHRSLQEAAKSRDCEVQECCLPVGERFAYFCNKVTKARLWSDDLELFETLKDAAGRFMDEIASMCDRRFQQLVAEPNGKELVNLFSPASEEELRKLSTVRRQDHPQVRAIVVHEEATQEASVWSRRGSCDDEELFVAQLSRRARLVNSDFQRAVAYTVAQRSETGGVEFTSDEFEMQSSVEFSQKCEVAKTATGHLYTASSRNLSWLSTSSPPKSVIQSNSQDATDLVTHHDPFSEKAKQKKFSCTFRNGAAGIVEVWGAPVKAARRMMEKIKEYAAEGAPWPLCAQILDPVRSTVVCDGPAQMLDVFYWFLEDSENTGKGKIARVPSAGFHIGRPSPLHICRVKNKFALSGEELVGGYRDLMLFGVVKGAGGLSIIGEVQIHDRALHDLKLLMHKLYRVRRAKTASVI